jgi:hypothetical protein
MQATVQTVHFTAGGSSSIAANQAPLTAGNLSINGALASVGVATLPQVRRVSITSAASNEAAETFTLTGTDRYGNVISEKLAGPGATQTVTSVLDYATISQVAISAASGSNISVGTLGTPVGSAPWLLPNRHITPFNMGVGCIVSGTLTWTVEKTYDDPNLLIPSNSVSPPNVFTVSGFNAITTTLDDLVNIPATAIRITVNSGTGTGTFYTLQAGLAQ